MPRRVWTVEQCREMGRRSAARRAERKAALAANPLPSVDRTPVEPGYVDRRLQRVRAQLDRIDAMILTETDPQKLDRLAAAQERLSRQEHDLAGRPHAGNLRPTSKPSAPTMPTAESPFGPLT